MVETVYKIPNAPHIALLADLHGRPYQRIIDRIRCYKPDLICIAGDIIYGTQPENDQSPLYMQVNVIPFLKACSSIAPSFMSLGNHEWMLDEDDLKHISDCGVIVLDNGFRGISFKGKQIVIGGLTSAYCLEYRHFLNEQNLMDQNISRYPNRDTVSISGQRRKACRRVPDTIWLEEFAAQEGYHILLSHHPEYWSFISRYPIELCLSAHAHGGQWRIFGHGVWTPGQGFWPKLTSGVHDGRLVISRGLSNTARIPRIFNPTEVVFVESK